MTTPNNWGYTKKENCEKCGVSEHAPGVVLEIDHIIPRALNGSNDASNLQTLCARCHREKTIEDRKDAQQKYGDYRLLKARQRESVARWKERNIRAGREDIINRRYFGREYDTLFR